MAWVKTKKSLNRKLVSYLNLCKTVKIHTSIMLFICLYHNNMSTDFHLIFWCFNIIEICTSFTLNILKIMEYRWIDGGKFLLPTVFKSPGDSKYLKFHAVSKMKSVRMTVKIIWGITEDSYSNKHNQGCYPWKIKFSA